MTRTGRVVAAMLCGGALIAGAARAETTIEQNGASPAEQLAEQTTNLFAELRQLTQLGPLVQVVATEGARHGIGLERSLFPGRGGEAWAGTVARIQAPEKLADLLAATVREAMEGDDLVAVHAFFDSDLGRRVAQREVTSRRAMLDAEVEAGAMDAAATLTSEVTPRTALIDEMIDRMDLVTANVSGGLNANFMFYRGLGDGGALRKRMTESEMLAMVWGQEEQIRQSTGRWLRAYLMLAYAPLSDGELRDYIDFLVTPAGRRYNAALFDGFGRIFERTSYDLGLAAAEFMQRKDI